MTASLSPGGKQPAISTAQRSVPPSAPASERPSDAPRTIPQPWWAWVVCVGSIVSFVTGSLLYAAHAPSLPIAAIELGGHEQTLPLPPGLPSALAWDLVFIAGYGLALWLGTTAARWVFWTRRAATLARLARSATLVVVVADLVENLCLSSASKGTSPFLFTSQAVALDAAATAATIKFVLLVPTAVMAFVGVVVAVFRLLSSRHRRDPWPMGKVVLPPAIQALPPDPPTPGAPSMLARARAAAQASLYRTIPPDPADPAQPANPSQPAQSAESLPEAGVQAFDPHGSDPRPAVPDEPRWRHAYAVPGITPEELAQRPANVTGFCLSGGGIRSGSVAMGALQTLRSELRKSRYLVSISGGGYTSGALAHLLTDAGDAQYSPPPGRAEHDPAEGYGPGSVELDHVRRHSSYLATTATQMLVALGVLARGLLATLLLLYAPAVVIGIVAAWFYHAFPLATLPLANGHTPIQNSSGVVTTAVSDAGLRLPTTAVLALAVVAGLALLTWLLEVFVGRSLSDLWQGAYRRFSRASVFMSRIAVITAIGAVGVPALLWASGRIVALTNGSVQVGIGGSVGTVLLTYLAGLASIGWRNRKKLMRISGKSGKRETDPVRAEAVPNGLLQLLLVIASVAVLALSWLLLLGVAAVGTASDLAAANPDFTPSIRVAVILVVAVVVLGGLLDESSLSLHPYYRRRLASAFATRAVTVPGSSGQGLVAVPYHPRELTTLSKYARPAEAAKPFPEFIFAAAAHLTGEDRTPAGLTAVSFTMSADWVGGPDVGWVDTATLEDACPDRLQRDITVQAAVAISGAAFASAMGRFARWYQIILAISGARLGAWLPNPRFLGAMRSARDDAGKVTDWTLPGLPSIRRGTYLLRELFNIHPQEERLLQVTDGGHYENLGIVELLRRRCTTIYCIDGGGDKPPTASGLAEAIALAEAELGVRIDLTDPFDSEPGAGRRLVPDTPLATLNATLTKEPVIRGTIHYPAASGLPESSRTGVLYVARALLWPEMSYSLLSYAAQHPVFPHDSTGDQWFDDGQFTAYTQLGRELGQKVQQVRERPATSRAGIIYQNGGRLLQPSRLQSPTDSN